MGLPALAYDEDDYDDSWHEEEPWYPEGPSEEVPLIDTRRPDETIIVPSLKPSEFTARAFMMPKDDGDGYGPFSFDGRRHLPRIYDTPARRILLCCGRQVEKSTMLGNRALCYSALVTAIRILYVSPSATQTKTFSNDRIKEPIETSPLLRGFTTRLLSQNVFEKQFVNRSKITLRYAFLNADRCVVGDTRAHFTDGSVATVREVFNDPERFIGKSVWAAEPSTRNVVPARLTGVVHQGVREVFAVRVAGGVELKCTGNQPLLTWRGWKTLDQLSPDDFVAVPRYAAHGAGHPSPVEEFRLVGYLLGDGATKTMNACALHNGNKEVLDDFRRCARALGARLWKEQDSNESHWVHSKTRKQGLGGGRDGYKKRLKQLGLIGSYHATKRVPAELFTGDEKQIHGLLSGLFATDGWASVSSTGAFEIGYCSNSKGLLQDIRQLLLRFGVHAFISRKKKPSTKKALGAYTLSIRHSESVINFAARIGIVGKHAELAAVVAAARRVTRAKNDYDRIPLSYEELREYLYSRYGLSTHAAWKKHRIQLRPGNTRDSIGRKVLHSIGARLGDAWLMWLAAAPLGWARIEEITPVGREETFDLSVDGLENYLSDGIFVHNTRGIPAWQLYIDEIQDILRDNIPVIEQCTSHAPDKWKGFVYSGTPKSLDNVIEEYRANKSTQGEWVVPCDGCGNWNVLGEKNIGRKGPICSKCGKIIDPQGPRCQWAWMVEPDEDRIKIPWESYRVPQLMVPWKIRNWNEVLHDYENYSRAKFFNECLGISFESGTRPITQAQIRAQCGEYSMNEIESLRNLSLSQPFFMGIDWGSGDNSYTVVTIATYVNNRFRVLFMHRFTGEDTDPGVQIGKILEMARHFNVATIGADYGFGFGMNHHLVRAFGINRVHTFQHMARINKRVVYDTKMLRWKVHRTEVMSAIFEAIKKGKAEFPRWEEFHRPFAEDFTNIYSEYNEKLRMIMYDHKAGNPDDSFHSFLFCWLGSMVAIRRPDIIAPNLEGEDGTPMSSYNGPVYQG